MRKMIVAIDGPAGSGKGTITKLVGKKLDLIYIDTGAMYRCVTLECLNKNVKIEEIEGLKQILENIDVQFLSEDDEQKVFLNGKDVTLKIRSKEVNEYVSPVSTVKIVRSKMTDLQRKMAVSKDVIMEGRDIGTTVFPNADVKIYLDATPEERASRRYKQNLENGITTGYDEILANVKERDYIDSHREISPLRKAEDAIYIDSTNMTIEEVVAEIERIILSKR
ncbi:MAG: (d)CMP kinase [Clostridia bacterium]|nr:(d)CMP kinase [Clostridia bacterium]